jgi:hypothetical protein
MNLYQMQPKPQPVNRPDSTAQSGLTATSTRTVIVEAAAVTGAGSTASPTLADTSSTQATSTNP